MRGKEHEGQISYRSSEEYAVLVVQNELVFRKSVDVELAVGSIDGSQFDERFRYLLATQRSPAASVALNARPKPENHGARHELVPQVPVGDGVHDLGGFQSGKRIGRRPPINRSVRVNQRRRSFITVQHLHHSKISFYVPKKQRNMVLLC